MTLKEKQDYLRKNGNLCCTCRNKEICMYHKQFDARRVEYWYKHGVYLKVDQCAHYKEKEVN